MTLSNHLSDHQRLYSTAALTLTFLAGILVTLGFKDLYPDLERRYKSSSNARRSSTASLLSYADPRRSSLFFGPPLQLEDHESPSSHGDPLTSFLPNPLGTASTGSPTISQGIESTIGHTPLILLKHLSTLTGRSILAKAEFLNGCGGTPKDRVALSMLLAAEQSGRLVPHRGDTIYEGTVGSTGISLATLARARGYRCHICMPSDMAMEKSDLLVQLGATVERVTPAPITSPDHFVNLARRRAAEHAAKWRDGSVGFFADQFESPANWQAHLHSTGPEIYAQTGGEIAAFVCGAGTGGTISGVATYLKEHAKMGDAVQVVLADPQGSGLFNKVKYGVMYSPTEKEGTRRRQQVDTIVEGIGITRITENFEAGRELIDDAVKVTDDQACRMARWLVENEGIFAGSSSAVNLVAAVVTAMKLPEGSNVVTILCDSGQRHLSKFYKRIGEMGLDDHDEALDLFALLGIEKTRA
ncbi:pyridoxal-phosphate dependent enzyme [Coniella lustricola]|uniref:Cysteine synthase 2 n=1 Tax=Coniella lustricola TaxID=2025994 RepID=A0A2T3A9T7_9PEZI|nr:pyridoxal-phosphate dependent enzyme [Coniella lustricola]